MAVLNWPTTVTTAGYPALSEAPLDRVHGAIYGVGAWLGIDALELRRVSSV